MNDIVIKQPKIYSPLQIGMGSFFGGPVAMVYFLWQNFKTLDNQNGARYTLAGGILFIVALLIFAPLLQKHFPSPYIHFLAIPFIYALTALSIAATWQLRKDAIQHSVQYQFQSNWRVFFLSVALLFAAQIGAYVVEVWMNALGFIDLGGTSVSPSGDDLII